MNIQVELPSESEFLNQLEEAKSPIAPFKARLKKGHEILTQHFTMGVPVEKLVAERAELIDSILQNAWRHFGLCETSLCLVAVGGYGRGELHPGSDIDITILKDTDQAEDNDGELSAFITFLWDIGMEVGATVRSVQECREESEKDITVVTNLTESRFLIGHEALFDEMRQVISPDQIWSNKDFYSAKLEEQIARHKRFADSAHNLEPNVKESPGGLRDIQMIGWVVKRYFGADKLEELVTHGFLTNEEYQTLAAGQNFLWRVRYVLHDVSGRREDRLLFEHQQKVAANFGFNDDERNLAVEHFMKLYYRTITELNRLNEMLLSFFNEALIEVGTVREEKPLNKRFTVKNNAISITRPDTFKRYPFALLEIFLLIQSNPEITGVRARTIRAIRDHLYLIDDTFRNDLANRSLFIEIMRQPRLGHELQRMHRYGVLAAYLPAFEAISGLMQFDLFHVFTVDEHILAVVRNLRRFDLPETKEELPLCYEVVSTIPKPELLYLAGLFHDIAKGRAGDHSILGEVDAQEFCVKHGLGKYDTNLVAWLVKKHLYMSHTAQRKDLSDQEVINNFACEIGDKVHLDYLYLLTVADMRGTNPAMWNSWKDSLLKDLYKKTLKAIRRGIENPLQNEERIKEAKDQVLHALKFTPICMDHAHKIWDDLGDDYFLRHSTDEIIWQTQNIIDLNDENIPVVKIRPETKRGGTEIFIYCHDKDSLFAAMAYAMDEMGLSVLDARIFTTKNGYNLDTYIVHEAHNGEPVSDPERIDHISNTLMHYLTAPQPMLNQINRMQPRKLRSFSHKPTITFSIDAQNDRTLMEVTAMDQPGLLAVIGMGMAFCGIRLHNARVATFGERVEDIFYITDFENKPITDQVKIECLEHTILDAINHS